MITLYKDKDTYFDTDYTYYDDQLRQLDGAKAAYDYVVACYKSQGIAVSEKRYRCYEDDMHEDEQITKDITELSFANTEEVICQYSVETYEGWGGKNYIVRFNGSKYVVIKLKNEWKALTSQISTGSAAQAVPKVNAQPEKVNVVLNRTNQEVNEKYHFGHVNDNSPIWRIWGNAELGEARLSLDQGDLGSLNMFVLAPYTLFPLRDKLEAVCKKKFVCQCSSEMGKQKDGIEFYRQTVYLADENIFNQTNRNTMIGTSMMNIVRITYIGAGQERIMVYFNQKNPYLEFKVLTK